MAVAYPSIKCGSVGLNLDSANRVVNMDLSWNYAAESQAYDRVHRLGQEKEVFVKRLVVRNTIEERYAIFVCINVSHKLTCVGRCGASQDVEATRRESWCVTISTWSWFR